MWVIAGWRLPRSTETLRICYYQEVHGFLLDDLVKEWGVEDKWTKEARLEAVKEWHSLPGTSGLVVRVPWYRAANLATTPLLGWADSSAGLKRLHKKFILQVSTALRCASPGYAYISSTGFADQP